MFLNIIENSVFVKISTFVPPQTLRAKRSVEQSLEEVQHQVSELSTINISLASSKSKLEQELSILAGDYDEVSKELKVK